MMVHRLNLSLAGFGFESCLGSMYALAYLFVLHVVYGNLMSEEEAHPPDLRQGICEGYSPVSGLLYFTGAYTPDFNSRLSI